MQFFVVSFGELGGVAALCSHGFLFISGICQWGQLTHDIFSSLNVLRCLFI